MGCPAGCRIDKDNSAGVLYNEQSQDSSFETLSGTVACSSTGTGSLVGERSIEGPQGTAPGDAVLTVGVASWFTGSWPSGLSGLASSERALYKGMTLDRASDDDYVPSSVVVDDVAMSLGENKTSEANGLGDSRHASAGNVGVEGHVALLPSTVPYSVSATQDILGAQADYEAGVLPSRPAELDSDAGDSMEIEEQSAKLVLDAVLTDKARIDRLESGVEDDRDLFDRLRDITENLEITVKDLLAWKTDVVVNGCSRCSVRKVEKTKDANAIDLPVPVPWRRPVDPSAVRRHHLLFLWRLLAPLGLRVLFVPVNL